MYCVNKSIHANSSILDPDVFLIRFGSISAGLWEFSLLSWRGQTHATVQSALIHRHSHIKPAQAQISYTGKRTGDEESHHWGRCQWFRYLSTALLAVSSVWWGFDPKVLDAITSHKKNTVQDNPPLKFPSLSGSLRSVNKKLWALHLDWTW